MEKDPLGLGRAPLGPDRRDRIALRNFPQTGADIAGRFAAESPR